MPEVQPYTNARFMGNLPESGSAVCAEERSHALPCVDMDVGVCVCVLVLGFDGCWFRAISRAHWTASALVLHRPSSFSCLWHQYGVLLI